MTTSTGQTTQYTRTSSTAVVATEPTFKQRKILDAYFELPNAAAIERSMDVSEKTVRNLAKKFASYLEAKREARDAERLERALARTTRVQTWLDDTLDDDMRRLDELTKSWNDNVALQALRTKFAMTASLRIAAASGRAASSTVDDGELRSMIGNFNSGRSAS